MSINLNIRVLILLEDSRDKKNISENSYNIKGLKESSKIKNFLKTKLAKGVDININ